MEEAESNSILCEGSLFHLLSEGEYLLWQELEEDLLSFSLDSSLCLQSCSWVGGMESLVGHPDFRTS